MILTLHVGHRLYIKRDCVCVAVSVCGLAQRYAWHKEHHVCVWMYFLLVMCHFYKLIIIIYLSEEQVNK